MKHKYQKPIARNLGDILPGAKGVCVNGSNANTGMPTSEAPGCFSGLTASGAGCGFGQAPAQTACAAGTIPQYFGCGYGLDAVGPCSTGQNVT